MLTSIIPVTFFDEFDSNCSGRPLGWLKYFLSPMQDGVFKEGEVLHPLGKCIFVFAGGTKDSFKEFDPETRVGSDPENKELKDEIECFHSVKGTDFISRLRGFVDIMGPNRNGEKDAAYIIRRAKILRSSFARTDKTKQLFNAKNELQIDEAMLRAKAEYT